MNNNILSPFVWNLIILARRAKIINLAPVDISKNKVASIWKIDNQYFKYLQLYFWKVFSDDVLIIFALRAKIIRFQTKGDKTLLFTFLIK